MQQVEINRKKRRSLQFGQLSACIRSLNNKFGINKCRIYFNNNISKLHLHCI